MDKLVCLLLVAILLTVLKMGDNAVRRSTRVVKQSRLLVASKQSEEILDSHADLCIESDETLYMRDWRRKNNVRAELLLFVEEASKRDAAEANYNEANKSLLALIKTLLECGDRIFPKVNTDLNHLASITKKCVENLTQIRLTCLVCEELHTSGKTLDFEHENTFWKNVRKCCVPPEGEMMPRLLVKQYDVSAPSGVPELSECLLSKFGVINPTMDQPYTFCERDTEMIIPNPGISTP
jgi:hypothetical protein